eukprot:56731-Prorocentrum_minimum.AAC.6
MDGPVTTRNESSGTKQGAKTPSVDDPGHIPTDVASGGCRRSGGGDSPCPSSQPAAAASQAASACPAAAAATAEASGAARPRPRGDIRPDAERVGPRRPGPGHGHGAARHPGRRAP